MQIPERLIARGPIDAGIYLVSTPIGNLGDLTLRALRVLSSVDTVLAEDTRRARQLLTSYGLNPKLVAVHQHNEERLAPELVAQARDVPLALVSDAGTPLLSDPGLPLVREAIKQGLPFTLFRAPRLCWPPRWCRDWPWITCSSWAFCHTKGRAEPRLERGERSGGAMVLYEAANRIELMIRDLEKVCGGDREIVLCRELTKLHEQVWRGRVADATAWYQSSKDHAKGEYVVVVSAGQRQESQIDEDRVLRALVGALPPSKAAKVAAEITGQSRRSLFERLERLNKPDD